MAEANAGKVNNDVETKIINVAKSLFIEKGFAETHMSDIAEKVGITRPALHYYFRTKDKIFQVVFATIIQSVIPKVKDILSEQNMPIGKRVEAIVDTYYTLFKENPYLPLFVVKEIHRDVDHLIYTIRTSPMKDTLIKIKEILQKDMQEGRLKKIPFPVLFYTFYGMLIYPFLTKNLIIHFGINNEVEFENVLARWKSHIISQMEELMTP